MSYLIQSITFEKSEKLLVCSYNSVSVSLFLPFLSLSFYLFSLWLFPTLLSLQSNNSSLCTKLVFWMTFAWYTCWLLIKSPSLQYEQAVLGCFHHAENICFAIYSNWFISIWEERQSQRIIHLNGPSAYESSLTVFQNSRNQF